MLGSTTQHTERRYTPDSLLPGTLRFLLWTQNLPVMFMKTTETDSVRFHVRDEHVAAIEDFSSNADTESTSICVDFQGTWNRFFCRFLEPASSAIRNLQNVESENDKCLKFCKANHLCFLYKKASYQMAEKLQIAKRTLHFLLKHPLLCSALPPKCGHNTQHWRKRAETKTAFPFSHLSFQSGLRTSQP